MFKKWILKFIKELRVYLDKYGVTWIAIGAFAAVYLWYKKK